MGKLDKFSQPYAERHQPGPPACNSGSGRNTHTPATLAAICLVHLHHVRLSLALLQQRSLAHRALQHLLGFRQYCWYTFAWNLTTACQAASNLSMHQPALLKLRTIMACW